VGGKPLRIRVVRKIVGGCPGGYYGVEELFSNRGDLKPNKTRGMALMVSGNGAGGKLR